MGLHNLETAKASSKSDSSGPVGGADSKTDSSTYPVPDALVDRRYWVKWMGFLFKVVGLLKSQGISVGWAGRRKT